MSESKVELAILQGADQGKVWILDPDQIYEVGRCSRGNVVLSDKAVSHHHARIEFQDGIWLITDLKSKHGTWVNGQRIEGRKPLFSHDHIQMGKTVLEYRHVGQGDSTEAL